MRKSIPYAFRLLTVTGVVACFSTHAAVISFFVTAASAPFQDAIRRKHMLSALVSEKSILDLGLKPGEPDDCQTISLPGNDDPVVKAALVNSLHTAVDEASLSIKRMMPDRHMQILALCVCTLAVLVFPDLPWFSRSLGLLALAAISLLTVRYERRITPPVQTLVRQLAALQDVHSIRYLLHAAQFGDKATRDLAKVAIARTLPDLSTEGAEALSKDDRVYLYRLLLCGSEEIVMPILSAIPLLGDTGAIPAVEKLATGHSIGRGNVEIQLAAGDALAYLISRRSLETTQRVLVRPSDSNRDTELTALRPTSKGDSCSASQLLRVSGSKSDDVGGQP